MKNVLTRKLQLFGELSVADRDLLDDVVSSPFTVAAHQDLIREGDRTENVHVILSGLACRNQILPDGKRQITAFLLPGDFCDLHVFILKTMDHTLTTLGPVVFARVPRTTILELLKRPELARALWWATLVDEAVLRAALVNVGTRSAEKRIAHLLCELHMRMLVMGLVQGGKFDLPLTQLDISNAVGISTVHANRSIQALRRKELILANTKSVTILDVERLQQFAGFDANYLHLDGGKHDPAGR